MKGEKGIEKKVSVSSGEGPDIVQIHVCLSFVPKKLWPFKDFDVRAFFLKTFPGIINLTSDEMLC